MGITSGVPVSGALAGATTSTGWSAMDVYDNNGVQQVGFGWGNSGATVFANQGYFAVLNNNPFVISINGALRQRIGNAGTTDTEIFGRVVASLDITGQRFIAQSTQNILIDAIGNNTAYATATVGNSANGASGSFYMTVAGSVGFGNVFGVSSVNVASLEVNSTAGGYVGNRQNGVLRFGTNDLVRMSIDSGGNIFVGGITTPTALLHIKAGTTAASSAPLKFTSGPVMTTAEAGAIEFTTDDFFATITTGAARKAFILDDGTRLTSGRHPVATTNGRLIDATLSSAYTPTNVTTDRSYDANATTIDELADIVGTLIADLQAAKQIS